MDRQHTVGHLNVVFYYCLCTTSETQGGWGWRINGIAIQGEDAAGQVTLGPGLGCGTSERGSLQDAWQ